MPLKTVYGRKKAAQCQQINFAKFVASEKDGATKQRGKQTVPSDLTESSQISGDTRSRAPVDIELDSLEKCFQDLNVSQSRSQEKETAGEVKRKPRKVHRKWTEDDKEIVQEENHDDCKPEIKETSSISDNLRPNSSEKKKRRGRPRKVLDDCDANEARNMPQRKGQANEEKVAHDEGLSPVRQAKARSPRTTTQPKNKDDSNVSAKPHNIYSSFVAPLLPMSSSDTITPFSQWSAELEPHFTITKIAEASFSEVYRLSAKYEGDLDVQESVLKVVALKTPPGAPFPCQKAQRCFRGCEDMLDQEAMEREQADQWKSEVADVLSEIRLLRNLNQIPGFTNFRDLTVLQGRPSPAFSRAWTAWNKLRPRGMKSEFPDPSKRKSYDDNQLFAVLEMEDAGSDCEKLMEQGELCSVWAIWDVFWGVCLSVAKAEEMCRFEHRDLHMGNICVRSSKSSNNYSKCVVQDVVHRKFNFTGLETTVIDYTLSRADIVSGITKDNQYDVAFLDLDKDPALFEGDASVEYQYEIYRCMRGAALYNNPLQHKAPQVEIPSTPRRSPRKNTHIRFDENDTPSQSILSQKSGDSSCVWREFRPKTNLVWMHFLLVKLLKHLYSNGKGPNELAEGTVMADIEAGDVDLEPRKVKQKIGKLYKILLKVNDLLSPIALGKHDSLGSVKELVVLALEERWLRVNDVSGC